MNGVSTANSYAWFMEQTVDAEIWSALPSVSLLTFYNDGGKAAGKMVFRTARQLCAQHGLEPGPWEAVWDNALWSFITKHKKLLEKFGQAAPLLRELQRKNAR